MKIFFHIFAGNRNCPVQSFLKYRSKLHKEITVLWQRPLDSFIPDKETWYCKSPLGKNTLAKMTSEISRQGQLSQRYTNHSIRSTAITKLDEAGKFKFFDRETIIHLLARRSVHFLACFSRWNIGYEARHIMTISGHKNEASIRSYSSSVSEDQSRNISDSLVVPTTESSAHNGVN